MSVIKKMKSVIALVGAALLGLSLVATACGGAAAQTVTVTSPGTGSSADLVVYGDLVTNIGCLAISVGHRGELIIWRVRVIDPATGQDMDDKAMKSVKALLPDGQVFDLTYGGHPGGGTPTDWFWAYAWEIPLNYPTGALGYEVQAEALDGRTGTFTPFEVASSKLNIKEFDPAYVAGKSTNITATGFSNKAIVASQGAKVTFNNKDTVPHTVVGDGWTSGEIAPGKNFARVFDTPGTFNFRDAANAGASGTITVNPVK